MTIWLRAFLLTQTVEMAVHATGVGPSRPRVERLAIAFAASAITHPIVWFVLPDVLIPVMRTGSRQGDYWAYVAIAELFAWSAEALWLRAFGVPFGRAAAFSLMANGASFGLGLFVYRVFGW